MLKSKLENPQIALFGVFIWYVLVKTEFYMFWLARNNFVLPVYCLWVLETGPGLGISGENSQALDI